jgi:hypothetical protein
MSLIAVCAAFLRGALRHSLGDQRLRAARGRGAPAAAPSALQARSDRGALPAFLHPQPPFSLAAHRATSEKLDTSTMR